MRRVLVAVTLALLLTACNDMPQPGPSEELYETEWDNARVSPDGHEITIAFTGSKPFKRSDPCSADYKANVFEYPDHVRIGIVAMSAPGSADALCTMEAHTRTVTARLKEPLGSRQVLDSSERPQRLNPAP